MIFLQDALIVCKTKPFKFFPSSVKIEWIKASFINMDLFYKKVFLIQNLEVFVLFFSSFT